MDSLEHGKVVTEQIPRFDDGMVNIQGASAGDGRGARQRDNERLQGAEACHQEAFPSAAWQRCIVHLMRNATSCAPTRQKQAAVLAILHAVFAGRDPELVHELYRIACEKIAEICPKTADLLEDAEADAPAYPDFPHAHIGTCAPTTCKSAPTGS